MCRRSNWQGMNWCRQEKRLAIYLRDNLECVYCGDGITQGVTLSLDHVKPYSKGGTNHESNLVTSCQHCNTARNNRTIKWMCNRIAKVVEGWTGPEIRSYVFSQARIELKPYLDQAKRMLRRQGKKVSCKIVLDEMSA